METQLKSIKIGPFGGHKYEDETFTNYKIKVDKNSKNRNKAPL